jgi:hypothetical protein
MVWKNIVAAVVIASVVSGVRIPVTMVSSVNSGNAKVGDTFTFRTTQDVHDGDTTIPSGSLGHGIVTAVSPAAGAHRGTLSLQPQYIDLASGTRVNVAPAAVGSTDYAARRHLFPFPIPVAGIVVVGGVMNPGGNITIGPGTTFDVVTVH